MKSAEYRFTCVVRQDTPYRVADGVPQGTQPSKGILHVGRVVWLKGAVSEQPAPEFVSAYAEGIGLITVDPNLLDCRG